MRKSRPLLDSVYHGVEKNRYSQVYSSRHESTFFREKDPRHPLVGTLEFLDNGPNFDKRGSSSVTLYNNSKQHVETRQTKATSHELILHDHGRRPHI